MNRKGQVLVFFVILIPIFLTLAAFVIDLGLTLYQSNRLNSINRLVIRYGLENIDKSNIRQKMITLLNENDSNIDNYSLDIDDNDITLKINKTINSVFSKVIDIKLYHITSNYHGYYKNNKIVIEKRK